MENRSVEGVALFGVKQFLWSILPSKTDLTRLYGTSHVVMVNIYPHSEAGFLVWFRYVPCSTKVRNSIPVPNLMTQYVPHFQRYFEGDGADLYCIC